MKIIKLVPALVAGLMLVSWGTAEAGPIGLDTVSWQTDGLADGTGTGTLAGGTITVAYTTGVGFDAGETFTETWASDTGTAAATGGSVTNQSGGALGGAVGGTLQTITFSSAVSDPILLVNFLGAPSGTFASDAFDFGSNTFTLLSSFNATASGNTVLSTTSVTDTANDGFGIQFNGTFGPASPLQFTYSSDGKGGDGLESVAFTVGTPLAAVPEPASAALLGIGLAAFGFSSVRRHLHV